MALLTVEQRKARFKYLGLGEYNKENRLKFQKKAFPNNPEEWDSKYGINTDRALRHFYNVKKYAPNFKPTEFKCTCGHCNGYPSYMKQVELKHIQRIRNHYKKPMTITSGLRCSYENSRVGGVSNSGHLTGYAVDFYMEGVTDTVAHRVATLKYLVKQPNRQFSYGKEMKDSNGLYREASGMGNAMHTETHKPVITFNKGKKNQYLTDKELKTLLDTLKKQYEWSKESKYEWVDPPTVENSKKRSTCISLYAVTLQRLGIFKTGGYFYLHPTKKKISGNRQNYVKNHPELFKLMYPHKYLIDMIKSGELQIGDYVGFGGKGYHSMAYLGYKIVKKKNADTIVPLFATMGHRRGYNITYPSYAARKVDMVVRLKKISK